MRQEKPSRQSLHACSDSELGGIFFKEKFYRFVKTDERKAGLVSSVPLKRVGKPEEIAQAIVFVSSDKASFITGASYLVDGGKTAR